MKKKTILYSFIAVIFTFPVIARADTASSTEATSSLESFTTSTSGSVLGLKTPTVPPLIAAIKNAKTQLASINLSYQLSAVNKTVGKGKKAKSIVSGYTLSAKDIALAIRDPITNSITITIGKQSGKTMNFNDPAVDVQLVKFNGVNSKFQINKPAGGIVVAEKYLISGTESGSKTKIEQSLNPAVYVPYSTDLASPDVTAYGANYLNSIIKNVTAQLENIPSRSIPGKTITQAIPPAMIKALVYAEHTDTTEVLYGSDINSTINKLNILFATNEGDAYNYSVSTAGARGIAQFIPSTYMALVQRHPEANLLPDFVAGMSDHTNAIKSMYLLLDDYAGAVRVKAATGFAEARVFEYGAASYNGGTTRVAKAVNAFGSSWNEDRNGQVTSIQGQINSLSAQAKSLKSKIGKTKDKKERSSLQTTLTSIQSQLAEENNKLDTVQSSTLRNETINYLLKIYKVIPVFNDQQI